MTLQAIIFDVDGTLAETEEVHRQAFNEIFREEAVGDLWPDPANGWHWSPTLYARLLQTTGGKERIAAYLRDHLDIDPAPLTGRIAGIHARKTARFGEILASGSLPLRPGIAETVDWARNAGLRLAIATTTSRPNVDAVCLAGFGKPAEELFETIAAGDEVAKKKPAPDVYHLALKRLCLGADPCLAIEDSLNGLQSAKAAGLRCLMIPSLYTADEDHRGADAIAEELSPARLRALAAR
ncbi:MAG: HAD-IA family hydrolase [Rhodomicrobiaceae bacterium]